MRIEDWPNKLGWDIEINEEHYITVFDQGGSCMIEAEFGFCGQGICFKKFDAPKNKNDLLAIAKDFNCNRKTWEECDD